MQRIGANARLAARQLAVAGAEQKSQALVHAATALEKHRAEILAANAQDIANGKTNGLSAAMLDRLLLDESRVAAIAKSLNEIASLPDPVGEVISQWTRPNGLKIERVRTPLGVLGVIYESRPNVTADAGALCLKSGNAVILRGGSDSFFSSQAIHAAMVEGLVAVGLPEAAIQLVPTNDRAAVGEMLAGLNGNLDVLVPRGGKGLVTCVQNESRVPVFAHLEGICHVYVDADADPNMAIEVVLNSKMRRTGICGAAETLLVHRDWAARHLPALLDCLGEKDCSIRGDDATRAIYPACDWATDSDWSTEYLAAMLSVKIVDDVDQAIDHIERYGSHHTECVLSESATVVERFFNEVDSAILLHNASTQFADGGEFGMGAEIGIATGKMHARGPVGVEQLTSFKYRVRGTGQIRI